MKSLKNSANRVVKVPLKEQKKLGVRGLSAIATQAQILRAAIEIFARYGYEGGSTEKISKLAKSHDRMIYYYFGSKQGLYVAAIQEIYKQFNTAEAKLKLDYTKPVEALKEVSHFIWKYYQKHPEFITLLNNENLHRGEFISTSQETKQFSSPAISIVDQVLKQGKSIGIFRQDITARDIYLLIASMGYFYLSNQYTLSAFLGEKITTKAKLVKWGEFIDDVVMRTVSSQTHR
jgi:TetR/AcrR family transcriptional regulator, upper aerobic nicotinate degradation pathway regulator